MNGAVRAYAWFRTAVTVQETSPEFFFWVGNLDGVNPIAAVLSGAMMCDWLAGRYDDPRLEHMARDIEAAVASLALPPTT